MPKIQETSEENVLEKPPSEAEALNSLFDQSTNKSDIVLDNTTAVYLSQKMRRAMTNSQRHSLGKHVLSKEIF
ncbi:hypothetical protein NQ314_002121 [Rhamnusium bicolor]|uniref:Uncharacterized protein n=1 Tax=Rhamnusium bicolor TaxID=1586634 RepID=A0AAV8ZQW3_9CUCU|nr:hypothetical protein NQ314_002121 [Rhamnusium bicolor]